MNPAVASALDDVLGELAVAAAELYVVVDTPPATTVARAVAALDLVDRARLLLHSIRDAAGVEARALTALVDGSFPEPAPVPVSGVLDAVELARRQLETAERQLVENLVEDLRYWQHASPPTAYRAVLAWAAEQRKSISAPALHADIAWSAAVRRKLNELVAEHHPDEVTA